MANKKLAFAKEKMIQCKYDEARQDFEEIIKIETNEEILDEAKLLKWACNNIHKGQKHIDNNAFKEALEVFETVRKTLEQLQCSSDLQSHPKCLLEKCKKAYQAQELVDEGQGFASDGDFDSAIEKFNEAKEKCNESFIERLCTTHELKALRKQVQHLKSGHLLQKAMEELKDGAYDKACGLLQQVEDLSPLSSRGEVLKGPRKEAEIGKACEVLKGGDTEKKLAKLKEELHEAEETVLGVTSEMKKTILNESIERLRKKISCVELFLEAKKKLGEVMELVKKTKEKFIECSEMDVIISKELPKKNDGIQAPKKKHSPNWRPDGYGYGWW